MNEYIQLAAFKEYAGIDEDDDEHDGLIRRLLTKSSRDVDNETHRFFYEMSETRKYDIPEYADLMFDWDLLSLTTLTNGNGSSIGSANYKLYPDPNHPPYLWLELNDASGIVWEYSTTPQQCIQVEALWGYHEEYGDAWESLGVTVNDDPLSSSATTLTPSGSLNLFERQQVLKIESEQVYVTEVGTTTVTIQRGRNGTTAAEHAQTTAISVYRPQDEIQEIACRICLWRFKQKDAIYEVAGHPELTTWEVPSAMPRDIVRDLKRFKKW